MPNQSQELKKKKKAEKKKAPIATWTYGDWSSDTWNSMWGNIIETSQKVLTQQMSSPGIAPPWFGSTQTDNVSLFDPDLVSQTFSTAMSKLAENPEIIVDLSHRHMGHMQDLFQKSMNEFQGIEIDIDEDIKPLPQDKRFRAPVWEANPFFSMVQKSYLLNAQFMKDVIGSIDGLDANTSRKLRFFTNHLIDALSPTNFPMTNPLVIQETMATGGENLVKGFEKYLDDFVQGKSHTSMTDMKAFTLGKNLGITPGKVVFQNDLFQLIQYEPLTSRVAKIPLLIVPPWINKYYIFDLQPENSFVKWALESGLTIFIMSWVNPDTRHSKKTMSDYVLEGVKTAVDQVCEISKVKKVNAIGNCAGGILLSSLIVYLKSKNDNRIASASIFATPFDFSKADDLGIFRCEHQQKKLEAHVEKKGYLEGQYMVKAFNSLRANDLIWSSYINNYLMGQEPFPFDMLYWNCDPVRMPGKMHMTYLRQVLIENRLMKPKSIKIGGVPLDFKNFTVPLFSLAAVDDHIAPWRSSYPITQMVGSTTKKFVLGASGHIAGVFNHPSRRKYHYWSSDQLPSDADAWYATAKKQEGSWWEAWRQWLEAYNQGTVPARILEPDRIIEDAPGSYAKTMAD